MFGILEGLSLYGKKAVTKCLVIPKVVHISLLLSIPKEIISERNRVLFKLSRNGYRTDMAERLSTTNEYNRGGIKIIVLPCRTKSLRLA